MPAARFRIAHTLLASIVNRNGNTRAWAQLLLVLARIFSARRHPASIALRSLRAAVWP